jgi:excisionase family DNA binding protein
MTRPSQTEGTRGVATSVIEAGGSRATLICPRLIDAETLSQVLGVSLRHVRRLVTERRIPFVKVGGLVRFDLIEVRSWIDQHRVAPVVRRGSARQLRRSMGATG